jgi:hypothetical protein
MEVSDQVHALAALPPREICPGTHWIGGWVCLRDSLDAVVRQSYQKYLKGLVVSEVNSKSVQIRGSNL